MSRGPSRRPSRELREVFPTRFKGTTASGAISASFVATIERSARKNRYSGRTGCSRMPETDHIRHGLTDEQKAVVNAMDDRLVVTAAAGAGKTFVLVERYLRHVEEGIRPEQIL